MPTRILETLRILFGQIFACVVMGNDDKSIDILAIEFCRAESILSWRVQSAIQSQRDAKHFT